MRASTDVTAARPFRGTSLGGCPGNLFPSLTSRQPVPAGTIGSIYLVDWRRSYAFPQHLRGPSL